MMTLEQLKTEVQGLSKEDRRKLGTYILELEKQYFQETVGPQLREDLDGLTKVAQETIEKVSKSLREKL
jgi:hypothetical protein